MITAELNVHSLCLIRRHQIYVVRPMCLKAPLEGIDGYGGAYLTFKCNLIERVLVHCSLAPDEITISAVCVDYGRSYKDSISLERDEDISGSTRQIHGEIDSISCLHTELRVSFLSSANSECFCVLIKVVRYDLLALKFKN